MPPVKAYKDQTTHLIKIGLARMTRRITVPIVHREQIGYTADVFESLAHKLRRISSRNSMRSWQKVRAAQAEVVHAHHALKEGWIDPRTQGAEELIYSDNGLYDKNGLDQLDKDLASGIAERRLMDARAKFVSKTKKNRHNR
tara:strand:+ start:31 stop:456 length:426 start_codon:yes stop_codon:yes gene_type:complete